VGKEKNKKLINQPHVILCEGEDATLFIIWYLEYLQKIDERFEIFQAFNFGGNEELPTLLSDIKKYPGYDDAASMIIIRDAESNYKSAVQSVKSALANSGLPVPSEPNEIAQGDKMKVAFSLFPSLSNNERNGTLEDLCIENLKEDNIKPLLGDINSFLLDLESKGRHFTWPHKAKIHTYFSVTDDFVSKRIGEATKAGAINFECSEMNTLKELFIKITRSD